MGQTFLSAARDQSPRPNVEAPAQEKVKTRRLPHWRQEGSTYFVTFRVAQGRQLDADDRAVLTDNIRSFHGRSYHLAGAVVMPDHVHVLLTPIGTYTLSRIMQGMKGATARLLNTKWKRRGQVWQDESWDRIVRDRDEFQEKLQYMLNNPVRKGLVADGWEWDGWIYQPDT